MKDFLANILDRWAANCWADLALFTLGHKLKLGGGKSCREESKTHSTKSCYCGKFYNGRLATKKDYDVEVNEPELPF